MDQKDKLEIAHPNFDPKNWLEKQLQAKKNSSTSYEEQLTELNFNLKMLQRQTEENIIQSQESIEQQQDHLYDQTEDTIEAFMEIKEYLDNNFVDDKMDTFSTENEELLAEISEMVDFKDKLKNQMDILEGVLEIDYIKEEIIKMIENKDLENIKEKLGSISQTLNILFELPKMHPRYADAEAIVQLVIRFSQEFGQEKFEEGKHIMSGKLCELYEILKIINQEQQFIKLYQSVRINQENIQIQLEQSVNQESNSVIDLSQYIENAINLVQIESDYLHEFNQYQLPDVLSELLRLYIIEVYLNLKEKLQSKYFDNNSCEAIYEFHNVFLGFLNFIQGLGGSENNIIQKKDMDILKQNLYQPFIRFVKKQSYNETQLVQQHFQKIVKSHGIMVQDSGYDEKIQEFSFLKILNISETSFKRIYEISFGVEIDEWKHEFEKNLEDYINKLDRLLYQTQNEHELNDENYQQIFRSVNQNSQQSSAPFQIQKTNINLKKNLGLLEILIGKYQELLYFQNQLVQLEQSIKQTLLKNKSNLSNNDIFLDIQQYLFEKVPEKVKEKQIILINIKNNDNFFEQTFATTKKMQEKIKEQILKLYLSQSYNDFSSIFSLIQNLNTLQEKANSVQDSQQSLQDKIRENASFENEVKNFSQQSEQIIHNIGQNFFLHVQMLEEMNNSLKNSSSLFKYIKENSQQDSNIVDRCYTTDIKSNPFLKHHFQEFQDQETYDFVKYWSFFYTFFLAKIYLIYHRHIQKNFPKVEEELIQAHIKNIEYFLNVFNSFAETCQSLTSLDQVLQDLVVRDKINQEKKGTGSSGVLSNQNNEINNKENQQEQQEQSTSHFII